MAKTSRIKLGTAALVLILLGSTASAAYGLQANSQLISTGARSCSYGYDAYTAAGTTYTRSIIHQQKDGVSSPWLQGLYTLQGQTRKSSAGWQGFSWSSVSDGSTPYSTGCY